MSSPPKDDLLVYAHIGDLHITRAGERNYRDFLSIAAQSEVAASVPRMSRCDGSDADTIGAWPERGILGTRLGPNRNGSSSS